MARGGNGRNSERSVVVTDTVAVVFAAVVVYEVVLVMRW